MALCRGLPLDFVVRFWSTGHVARKGVDRTGGHVGLGPYFRKVSSFDEYRWVVEYKTLLAVRDMVNLRDFTDRLPFEQRLVRLPLSDDGVDVHHVVSLACWAKA